MPPPALIGFVIPAFLARATQSATKKSNGWPESPPPPNSASGETSEPNNLFQLISSGIFPHGIVLETQMASQAEFWLILRTTPAEAKTLNFGISGMPRMEAIFSPVSTSSTRQSVSSPTFGQE